MFIIARTAKGRPTLMHRLADWSWAYTACGLNIQLWSRAYTTDPISQILCKKCAKKVN